MADRDPGGAARAYWAFGLRIFSEIELDDLLPVTSPLRGPFASDPDVAIRLGAVADIPEDFRVLRFEIGLPSGVAAARLAAKGEVAIFRVPGLASYRIEGGREILVDPASGANSRWVQVYLIGVALVALLHQRRWFPLHASAIAAPGGVWAFVGESGAGKSSLVAQLHRLSGWPIVCDDLAVLRDAGEDPWLEGGLARLKLSREIAEEVDGSVERFDREFGDAGKYVLRDRKMFAFSRRDLKGVIRLDEDCETGGSLSKLNGTAAFTALVEAVHGRLLPRVLGDRAEIGRDCMILASRVPVYRIGLAKDGERAGAIMRAIGQGDAKADTSTEQ